MGQLVSPVHGYVFILTELGLHVEIVRGHGKLFDLAAHLLTFNFAFAHALFEHRSLLHITRVVPHLLHC